MLQPSLDGQFVCKDQLHFSTEPITILKFLLSLEFLLPGDLNRAIFKSKYQHLDLASFFPIE